MAYTADDLITAVKRRGRIPDDSFTDAEYLAFADEEMSTLLVPLVRSHVVEFFIKETDTAQINDVRDYRIPSRTQSGGLRDLTMVDANDNEFNVAYITLDDHYDFTNGGSVWWRNGIAFSIIGDHVRIMPTPTTTDNKIRFRYFRRPGRLVTVALAPKITAIDVGLKKITVGVGLVPSAWTTGDTFDLVQGSPNFDSLGDDLAVTTIAGDDITFTATLPTDLAVGDYVGLKEEASIVQLPSEFHPVLYSAVQVRALEALGDADGAGFAQAKMDREINSVSKLISPRVEGEHEPIINWRSPLREGSRWP